MPDSPAARTGAAPAGSGLISPTVSDALIKPAGGGELTGPAAGGELTGPAAGGELMRDPAAVAAEADATGQATLVDVPSGAAEAARIAAFLSGARDLLAGYFAVEDPRRLEPAERESLISTMIGDELLLRGYIDRLDVSPAGDLRVVDYKTGGAPRQAFEGRALFQLKFYALVLWRTRGVVPRALRLLYLKDAEALDYSPEAGELERFERTLLALSQAIERAKRDRDFRPKPSRLCGWCSHQSLCPEFGGTPPPYPETVPISDLTPDAEPDRVGTLLRDDPLD
ncbi:RecB family exonuclease [Actinoplanes campanulatus]|uniref:RecB family exonuclease n=1 Tax=Actinoplanes campanulatus TaxID=113559 RepID=UPI00357140E6